jgi:sensor c-di-GMP phosphodiesterase-like protein
MANATYLKVRVDHRVRSRALLSHRRSRLPSRTRDEILADLCDVTLRAAMVLIAAMRLYMRTSNYLERLNREIERHACFVGVFPSKVSVIRLIGSVLTEENECSSTQRKSYYG